MNENDVLWFQQPNEFRSLLVVGVSGEWAVGGETNKQSKNIEKTGIRLHVINR